MSWISVVACVQQVATEEGQLAVQAPDLKTIGNGPTAAPLLAGTRTCPVVSCVTDCPAISDPLACFETTVTGSVGLDGACWSFDAPGPGRVDFTAVPCAANAEGYAPVDDGLAFEVLAASDVTAAPVDFEQAAEDWLDPGPAGAFPTDWGHPDGTGWTLVAGSPFTFFPILSAGDGREVGWTLADAVAESTTTAGLAPTVAFADGAVTVEVADGTVADVNFGVGADRWPLATVSGVRVDQVESLEVVVAYVVGLTPGTSAPLAARAIARDAGGFLVWGAPVVWTLDDGTLAVGDPGLALPGGDYVSVADACIAPSANGGSHTAVLRATLGSLSETVELDWDVDYGLSDAGFVASPSCLEGASDTGPTTTTTPPTTDPSTTPDTTPPDGTPPTVTGTPGAPDTEVDPRERVLVGGSCGGCDSDVAQGWLGAPLVLLVVRRSRRPRTTGRSR